MHDYVDRIALARQQGVREMDLRHLPAPEPMLRILQALPALEKGHRLLARTPFRPQPLLDRLALLGYRVEVGETKEGDAWVLVAPSDGTPDA